LNNSSSSSSPPSLVHRHTRARACCRVYCATAHGCACVTSSHAALRLRCGWVLLGCCLGCSATMRDTWPTFATGSAATRSALSQVCIDMSDSQVWQGCACASASDAAWLPPGRPAGDGVRSVARALSAGRRGCASGLTRAARRLRVRVCEARFGAAGNRSQARPALACCSLVACRSLSVAVIKAPTIMKPFKTSMSAGVRVRPRTLESPGGRPKTRETRVPA